MRTLILLLACAGSLAAQDSVLVPGWVDPQLALRQLHAPLAGGPAFAAGRPLLGHALSFTHAYGVDLMFRGLFRYHDRSGVAHGRSASTTLAGLGLQALAIAVERSTAPAMTSRANAERLRDARARTQPGMVPGLAPTDTVRLSNGHDAIVRDLVYRGGRTVALKGDTSSRYEIRLVRHLPHSTSANGVGLALGMEAGLVGSIALCVKQFGRCYPYTSMVGLATLGYYTGSVVRQKPSGWERVDVRPASRDTVP